MKKLTAAIAAVSLALPLGAALANPFVQDQVVLRHADLDLATAAGQNALAIRMDQAAAQVCGDRVANLSLVVQAQAQACRDEVVAETRTRIETRIAARSDAPVRLAYAR